MTDNASPTRLCLRDMGSFHVGGRTVQVTGQPVREHLMAEAGQPVRIDPNGTYVVEQMYAQYFLPEPSNGLPPLVFWHGGGMTGAAWETTPDGRQGWLHTFLRWGWDCYLCDAVERGRSGFAPVPAVWPQMPVFQSPADFYTRFRIGQPDGGRDAPPYPNTQFPVEAFDQLALQMVPRWTGTDAAILRGHLALLARTGPSVVVCHSQAGVFGIRAAHAEPERVRAVVALEPASIPVLAPDAVYTVPTLIVLGDNMASDARWPRMRERIVAFAQAHPAVEIMDLPALGIEGNSHLLMMDRNSAQIAALVQAWLMRTLGAPDQRPESPAIQAA